VAARQQRHTRRALVRAQWMITLHAYVLRELLKTFGLALTALTVLFTMGGGLYNVVRSEGVSTGDVVGFLPLLIPIVVTVTMPLAALFAATMVYGRLAADNELQACRAAGINIHRMFLSALLLSVFVAAFTLLFGNFVIPGLAREIDDFARSNIRDLVAQQLQHKGFVHRGKAGEDRYTFTAESVKGVSEAALREKHFEVAKGLHYLLVNGPSFLQIDRNGELVRFSVAKYVLCVFDTRVKPIEVTLHVRDGQDYQVGKQAERLDQQQIGPIAMPLPTPTKPHLADLRLLLRWRHAPWEAPELRDQIQHFLVTLARTRYTTDCAQRLQAGQDVRLVDDYQQRYKITAAGVRAGRDGLVLSHARVEVQSPNQSRPTIYEAERIELTTVPLPGPGAPGLMCELRLAQVGDKDVLEYDPRGANYAVPRHKDKLTLDRAYVPAEVLQSFEHPAPEAVLRPEVDLALDQDLGDRRIGLQKAAARLDRQIVATINLRMGFAASALVTLLMGAALGIMFRGARALAAFGLAILPFFCVAILIVLGKTLTEDDKTTAIGPFVTWGGLLLVLLADTVILRLGVRR
jgi:lipopolysaccharide export LptBFGC system permease protein LptF